MQPTGGGEGEDASLKQGGREQNDRVDVAALARLLSTVGPRATSTAGRSTRGIVGHSERLEWPAPLELDFDSLELSLYPV